MEQEIELEEDIFGQDVYEFIILAMVQNHAHEANVNLKLANKYDINLSIKMTVDTIDK